MSADVDSGGTEAVANSDLGSDETSTLLVCTPETTRNTQFQSPGLQDREPPYKNGNKPVLIRQDCTTSRLSVAPPRPLLSSSVGIGCVESEESGTGVLVEESSVRSVPDIELHCRMNDVGSLAMVRDGSCGGSLLQRNGVASPRLRVRGSSVVSYGHLSPYVRCKCDHMREPQCRLTSFPRSVSRESMRSIGSQHVYQCTPHSAPPAVLLTTTSSSSRVIRQSSQPESSVGEFIGYLICLEMTIKLLLHWVYFTMLYATKDEDAGGGEDIVFIKVIKSSPISCR